MLNRRRQQQAQEKQKKKSAAARFAPKKDAEWWQGKPAEVDLPGGISPFVDKEDQQNAEMEWAREKIEEYQERMSSGEEKPNEYERHVMKDLQKRVAGHDNKQYIDQLQQTYRKCFEQWILGKNDLLNSKLITPWSYESLADRFPRAVNFALHKLEIGEKIQNYLFGLYTRGPQSELEVGRYFKYLVYPIHEAFRRWQYINGRNENMKIEHFHAGDKGKLTMLNKDEYVYNHSKYGNLRWPSHLVMMGKGRAATSQLPLALDPTINKYMRPQLTNQLSYEAYIQMDYSGLSADIQELWEVANDRGEGRGDREINPRSVDGVNAGAEYDSLVRRGLLKKRTKEDRGKKCRPIPGGTSQPKTVAAFVSALNTTRRTVVIDDELDEEPQQGNVAAEDSDDEEDVIDEGEDYDERMRELEREHQERMRQLEQERRENQERLEQERREIQERFLQLTNQNAQNQERFNQTLMTLNDTLANVNKPLPTNAALPEPLQRPPPPTPPSTSEVASINQQQPPPPPPPAAAAAVTNEDENQARLNALRADDVEMEDRADDEVAQVDDVPGTTDADIENQLLSDMGGPQLVQDINEREDLTAQQKAAEIEASAVQIAIAQQQQIAEQTAAKAQQEQEVAEILEKKEREKKTLVEPMIDRATAHAKRKEKQKKGIKDDAIAQAAQRARRPTELAAAAQKKETEKKMWNEYHRKQAEGHAHQADISERDRQIEARKKALRPSQGNNSIDKGLTYEQIVQRLNEAPDAADFLERQLQLASYPTADKESSKKRTPEATTEGKWAHLRDASMKIFANLSDEDLQNYSAELQKMRSSAKSEKSEEAVRFVAQLYENEVGRRAAPSAPQQPRSAKKTAQTAIASTPQKMDVDDDDDDEDFVPENKFKKGKAGLRKTNGPAPKRKTSTSTGAGKALMTQFDQNAGKIHSPASSKPNPRTDFEQDFDDEDEVMSERSKEDKTKDFVEELAKLKTSKASAEQKSAMVLKMKQRIEEAGLDFKQIVDLSKKR